MVVDPILILSL